MPCCNPLRDDCAHSGQKGEDFVVCDKALARYHQRMCIEGPYFLAGYTPIYQLNSWAHIQLPLCDAKVPCANEKIVDAAGFHSLRVCMGQFNKTSLIPLDELLRIIRFYENPEDVVIGDILD